MLRTRYQNPCYCVYFFLLPVSCHVLTLHEGMVFNSPETVWNAEPKSIGKLIARVLLNIINRDLPINIITRVLLNIINRDLPINIITRVLLNIINRDLPINIITRVLLIYITIGIYPI